MAFDAESEIKRFKMALMRKMPFYGDIVLRLPFAENTRIATARTNGWVIEYNPKFLSSLPTGQRNFILMHEVMHVLLFHCSRHAERKPFLWNAAADIIVNSILERLTRDMKNASIPFEPYAEGIYADIGREETAENLYEMILADNKGKRGNSKIVFVRKSYLYGTDMIKKHAPCDIISENHEGGASGLESHENMLTGIIREAASKNRASEASYFVPKQIIRLRESKRVINWKSVLREFLTVGVSDEASYTTPERKYIHMDLILPGYGPSDNKIEEIWAFVDSSGSISKNETEQFLTQLYHIVRAFKCSLNICYWDTCVNGVYKNILNEDDILKSLPRHSGGTDINCVYRWLRSNKINPEVILILTDGFFGSLDRNLFIPSLGKRTVLVLSEPIALNADIKKIGKIARLI